MDSNGKYQQKGNLQTVKHCLKDISRQADVFF